MTRLRSELLRELLADASAEALVVVSSASRDPDLAPFVGSARLGSACVVAHGGGAWLAFFTSMEREEAALAAASGVELVHPADFGMEQSPQEHRSSEEILEAAVVELLDRAGIRAGALALAGRPQAGTVLDLAGRLGERGFRVVSGRALSQALRRRKTAEDLEDMEAAAEATVRAFRAVARSLARASVAPVGSGAGELRLGEAPLTVSRLKAVAAAVFAADGLEQPEGCVAAPAEEGATGHSTGTPGRVLRAGESVVVDLFPRKRLFADCTRTFCVGEPPPDLARAHALVAEALDTSLQALRPGVRGHTLHERVCRRFEAEGFGVPDRPPGDQAVKYVHLLGHGVGFELHELPSFRKEGPGTDELQSGDAVTIEPGLYSPDGGWGVRLEDLVVVTPDGHRNLTPLPRALDPRDW